MRCLALLLLCSIPAFAQAPQETAPTPGKGSSTYVDTSYPTNTYVDTSFPTNTYVDTSYPHAQKAPPAKE